MTATSHAFFLKPQVSVIPLAGEVLYEVEHEDLNALMCQLSGHIRVMTAYSESSDQTFFAASEGIVHNSVVDQLPPCLHRVDIMDHSHIDKAKT